jgi:REP element-mobilizing transposase RayT
MANFPQRKYHRYRDYDYSSAGAYFFTICVQNRLPLLGHVDLTGMHLNNAGQMVQSYWEEMPQRYPGVAIDALIIMPDHIHGIIFLGTDPDSPTDIALGQLIRWLKSWTTRVYAENVPANGWPRFEKRLWQQNYYDEILRNHAAIESRREYIEKNPWRWIEHHGLD